MGRVQTRPRSGAAMELPDGKRRKVLVLLHTEAPKLGELWDGFSEGLSYFAVFPLWGFCVDERDAGCSSPACSISVPAVTLGPNGGQNRTGLGSLREPSRVGSHAFFLLL